MSAGNMICGGFSYGGALDLQGSTPVNLLQHHHLHGLQHPNQPHQDSMIQSPIPDVSPLTMGQIQLNPINNLAARGKISASEEDEPSNFNEEGKHLSVWHRIKWTGSMVKLLITALSYIDEDVAPESGRRKYVILHKKGKWKTVSKVMAQRGFCVSPQQCEDKFNDLNKRYKKLNDILGRGTSCQVVENPALLEMMDHLPEKAKDEVKKILSSKHLFYEEMCSYHNRNRLHLPHDLELQRSLQLALRSRDGIDEDDLDPEADDHVEHEENFSRIRQDSAKRMKQGHEAVNLELQKWMKSRLVLLEQQKVDLEMYTLEMEKEKLKWQWLSRKKDRDLEKMKMENERMRIENEQMALELERIESNSEAVV